MFDLNPQILGVLAILLVSLVFFVTEWIPMDVVALMVLGALALSGLVTPTDALSGFSNPAVVTVWAMFILSEGLTRTGIAAVIGRQVMRVAGTGEARLVIVIMLTAGVLSALMNNIGVAALMLPVVMDIARQTGIAPSRLLMPLAYSTLLGGLTTLIGTPPNLLVSGALREAGFAPFGLFDFTPVGLSVMLGGTVFVALLGRRLLPVRDAARDMARGDDKELREQYALHERSFVIRVPKGSLLAGKTLAESYLGSAAGLNVIGVIHDGRLSPAPDPTQPLREESRLLVEGRLDRFNEIRGWRELRIDDSALDLRSLVSDQIELRETRIPAGSVLAGRTLTQAGLHRRFGVNVLAVRRGETLCRTQLGSFALGDGDQLLLQGRTEQLRALAETAEVGDVQPTPLDRISEIYQLDARLFIVCVPHDSVLVGESLADSRLGDAFGLRVLGIFREQQLQLLPEPGDVLAADDRLLLEGRRASLDVLRGLQQLEIERETPDLRDLESSEVSMVEVVLSPRSSLVGCTLPELEFRKNYSLQVLAIWREGTAHRSDLRNMALRFGDALLLLGRREKLAFLARQPDFLVLTGEVQEPPKTRLAPVAALIMLAVIVPVLLGWLPIYISAVVGVIAIVLSGCLSMGDAYRAIDWRSIFLIAGMLPLGTAMQSSGTANFLAEGVTGLLGPLGPWPLILGLYLLTALGTTVIPTAALVVLMSPIVLRSSAELRIAPQGPMMAIAMAASASFTSPISHPANVLVMGLGGYRFVDYVKLGVPLAVVVLLIVAGTVPVFWPLQAAP